MSNEEEDSQKLREAFKSVMELNNRETLAALSENLDTALLHYCNAHAVRVYAPLLGGPKEEPAAGQDHLKKTATMLKIPAKLPL